MLFSGNLQRTNLWLAWYFNVESTTAGEHSSWSLCWRCAGTSGVKCSRGLPGAQPRMDESNSCINHDESWEFAQSRCLHCQHWIQGDCSCHFLWLVCLGKVYVRSNVLLTAVSSFWVFEALDLLEDYLQTKWRLDMCGSNIPDKEQKGRWLTVNIF